MTFPASAQCTVGIDSVLTGGGGVPSATGGIAGPIAVASAPPLHSWSPEQFLNCRGCAVVPRLAHWVGVVGEWVGKWWGWAGGSVEQPGGPSPEVTHTPDRHTG